MGVAFVLHSVAGKSKKDIRITGSFQLDTRMLIEFGEAVENYEFDPPEGSSLSWIEGVGYDETLTTDKQNISPRECHSPEPVINSLRWLRSLAETGHDVARDTWKNEWHQREPFTSEGFLRPILHDLDGLEQFARQTAARGEKLIGMWVP